MGSKTTVQTSERSENKPPPWAEPGLSELGRRITQIIPTMPGPRYTGDFVAQPNALERQVPGMMLNTAQLAQQMVNPAAQVMAAAGQGPQFSGPSLGQGTQSFAQYDPTAIQPVVNAAIQPLMRQLQEQILPGIQSSAIEAGAYGGDAAMQVLPGMAIRDVGRQAAEIGTGIAYQDFADQQNRNLQAFGLGTERGLGEANTMTQRYGMMPDLMNTILQMSGSAADITAGAGGMQRGFDQAAIENALAQHDYGVRYPFQGLDVASALLGQIATPWGTRISNGTQTQSTGGLAPVLGGLMGAGMGVASLMGGGGMGGISSLFGRKGSSAPSIGTYPGAYVGWLGR